MNNKISLGLAIVLVALLMTAIAYAQSEAAKASPTTATGASIIVAWICYATRKRPIGGWLLYYYIQLYGGSVLLLVLTLASMENYYPQSWDDKTLYFLYLVSTIPSDLTHFAEFVIATTLLAKHHATAARMSALQYGSTLVAERFRKIASVDLLRYVFVAAVLSALVGLGIDLVQWKENIVFDLFAVVWPAVWFGYFTYSRRVRYVYKKGTWIPGLFYPE